MTDTPQFWFGVFIGIVSILGMQATILCALFWEYLHSVNGIAALVDRVKQHGN